MAEKQKTLAKSLILKGTGLHTGHHVKMTILPGEENQGILFQRIDLPDEPIIEAITDYVIDTSRGTTLAKGDIRISTVEHTLAALSGMGIDNATIQLDGPESPILDGSAKFHVQAIEEAGIIEQEADKDFFVLKEKVAYTNDELGIEIVAYPDDKLSVSTLIDYPSAVLRNQYAEMEHIDQFKDDFSACRTFVFFHELEHLLKDNLIKGGDIDNAIVIIDQKVTQEEVDKMAKLFHKEPVEIKEGNVLSDPDLQFPNEPARHKLLDIIGDITLAGKPIKAKIFARKPGHLANTEFAKIIRKLIKKEEQSQKIPRFDPDIEPLMDINQIKKILPHRPPFLLVDKILEMDENSIVGIKNVTMNEGFFVGHFPNEPVMPGVLQIEAMAQVGGIFTLNTVPDPENYLTYFLKVEHAKFKRKVGPGDTIVFKLELISPIRRGICNMSGTAFVGNKIVMEGELLAQIVKVQK